MMELKAKHPKMEMRTPVQRTGGGGIEQVQADWLQDDNTAVDYIKNKPEDLVNSVNGETGDVELTASDVGALPITGGEMQGNISMNNYRITSVPTPIYNGNAVNKGYVDGLIGDLVNEQELSAVAFSGDFDDLFNSPTDLSYFTNDVGYLTAHQDISGKANTADLADVAFSGSYNDLTDKPSGSTKPVYNLNFQATIGTMTRYTLSNPKEDITETINDISTGNANFVRQFNLTYDPIEQSQMPADASVFGEYKFLGLISGRYVYQRIMSFSNTFANPYIDELGIQISGTTISVFHSYLQLFDAVIVVVDGNWNSQAYPHAITAFNSTGGLWGSQNLASVKKARAGYASNFNFILRVNTHNDNVWLQPVETLNANSLPRFIGESEKLGKRIVVTFNDFANDGNPTGTIDMTDLVDDTHINGLIDDKLPTPRVAKTASDTTASLDPNKLYVWPTMATLDISLNAGDSDIVNEYHFIFTSGTTATTLTLPATVKQPYGFTVEANTTYEVSIMENCMVVQRWEA